MSFADKIFRAAQRRRDRKRKSLKGPLGNYYRAGGNELLYDLPISPEGIVIDAGGFLGDWTKNVISMYGCRSEIFEPIPQYASQLDKFFRRNPRVNVHAVGLGGAPRSATFSFQDDATTEFFSSGSGTDTNTQVQIVDVSEYLDGLAEAVIDCLKLNIEGAEYEVLERIISQGHVHRFKSVLVQFHRQPEGYERRLHAITENLKTTHDRVWHFPMVWEKWIAKSSSK